MPHLPDWLVQAAWDTATYEFWYAIGCFVLTALGLAWAYLKGVGKPILLFLSGILAGLLALLIIWLVLIWSGPKVLATINGLIFVAFLGYAGFRLYQREQARLQGHAKGLVDFKRDFRATLPRNLKAMTGLTKEMETITADTNKLTARLNGEPDEVRKEAILDQDAARAYRQAATRYRRRAETFQRESAAFTAAMGGIVGWLQQTNSQAQLQQYRPILESLRNSAVFARSSTVGFRTSVTALPSMSQRLNASRSELVEGIDISLSTMDAVISFAEQTLGQLPA